MKKNIMLFLLFGGFYFMLSSFLYIFSDLLSFLAAFLLPIFILLLLVLMYLEKVQWLENIKSKYSNMSCLLVILGGCFYSMLLLDLSVVLLKYVGVHEGTLEEYGSLIELFITVVVLIALLLFVAKFIGEVFLSKK